MWRKIGGEQEKRTEKVVWDVFSFLLMFIFNLVFYLELSLLFILSFRTIFLKVIQITLFYSGSSESSQIAIPFVREGNALIEISQPAAVCLSFLLTA